MVFNKDFLAEKFETKMINAFNKVYNSSKSNSKLSLRMAAYLIAIKRIMEAESFRGNL